jgi:inner membrane protein
MEEQPQSLFEMLRGSQFLRVLLTGFLVLLLQIPIVMIQELIRERSTTRQEAVNEITSKWGRQQKITGPRIVVPYFKRITETTDKAQVTTRTQIQLASFLPESLTITGQVDSDVRYRGIFEVPVYQMSLDVRGRFVRPDFALWGIKPEDILWDRAEVSMHISDARAIQNQAVLSWGGSEVAFTAGPGEVGGTVPGIHASLKDRLKGDSFEFSFPLKLNGSVGAFFAPFGKVTAVKLTSDWPSPSFQGGWLPASRTVSASGFEASWEIPSLGRNYPQQWTSESSVESAIDGSIFGVELISPVDQYRMADRSVKYAVLFLGLTFLSIWLFEVMAKVRVHPLQYLLVGGAMCLFYLLQLALSEHLTFVVAYIVASLSVVVVIAAYSVTVLKTKGRGLVVGVVAAALYGYLYVLLINQDYALLVGSIGLFLVLAAVMYLTRKIDWYELSKKRS